MVSFPIQGCDLDLPRNLLLLDTNVLVALVDEDDESHFDARLLLEGQSEYVLGVSPPTIVEACGLLSKRQDRVHLLLQLLLEPGNGVRILPAPHGVSEAAVSHYLAENANFMQRRGVDYVDAFLMKMADMITTVGEFDPSLVIATKDLRDFSRCVSSGYRYGVYVLNSHETFFV